MPSASHRTRWIALATLLAIGFAAWNAIDEFGLLQSYGSVAVVVVSWSALPLINALIGVRSKHDALEEISLVLAGLYALLFAVYALNGSTADRPEGAQHMHLVLVPLLLAFVSPAFYCLLLILWYGRKQRASTAKRADD